MVANQFPSIKTPHSGQTVVLTLQQYSTIGSGCCSLAILTSILVVLPSVGKNIKQKVKYIVY